ncbi:MAG: hypothetical protein H0W63_05420 [Gemmatimonadaceae bacterium]|nr:hypothetical protein [Gemmatimonadaceae bacterium]
MGCLLIIIAGLGGWYFYTHLKGSDRSVPGGSPARSSATWEPLNPAAAQRGKLAVESLSQRAGPVFANITPAEAASYIFLAATSQFPASAKNIQASAINDRLRVRSEISIKDFGGASVLGPLGSLIGDRDTVQLGGTIHVLRPGVGEFTVQEMKFGQAGIPNILIPRLVARLRKGNAEGLSDRGLPMKMPDYISDVRIENGKITLYKSVK